jgi:hypothetical protein
VEHTSARTVHARKDPSIGAAVSAKGNVTHCHAHRMARTAPHRTTCRMRPHRSADSSRAVRGVDLIHVQRSSLAAQTATAARRHAMRRSRPRTRARAWRPSRARSMTLCMTLWRSARTTPLGASGTQSPASSTGTRTGAARTTRSHSRCAPVRRTARVAAQQETLGSACVACRIMWYSRTR